MLLVASSELLSFRKIETPTRAFLPFYSRFEGQMVTGKVLTRIFEFFLGIGIENFEYFWHTQRFCRRSSLTPIWHILGIPWSVDRKSTLTLQALMTWYINENFCFFIKYVDFLSPNYAPWYERIGVKSFLSCADDFF